MLRSLFVMLVGTSLGVTAANLPENPNYSNPAYADNEAAALASVAEAYNSLVPEVIPAPVIELVPTAIDSHAVKVVAIRGSCGPGGCTVVARVRASVGSCSEGSCGASGPVRRMARASYGMVNRVRPLRRVLGMLRGGCGC